MSYWDYSDEKLIKINPHKIRGGLDTILSLAKLFDVGVDCTDAYSPIILCIGDRLSMEEVQVLRCLIKEYEIA